MTKIPRFGRDPDSWNIGDPDAFMYSELDDASGLPGIAVVSEAIRIYVSCQRREVLIAEAAEAFDMAGELVIEAAEFNPRMHVSGKSLAIVGPPNDADVLQVAVQVWAWAQARETVTVEEAALAFNTSPEVIRAAIEDHPWLFVGAGDAIEHDGE